MLKRTQTIAQSTFSGRVTSVQDLYSQWEVELGFASRGRGTVLIKRFQAWIDSLQGSIGTFLYSPADAGLDLTGKTLASLGVAYSNEIIATGWIDSEASGIAPGDLFSMNSMLFRIVSAPANASGGACRITIEPRIRANIPSGTTLNFARPVIKLRLMPSDDASGGYSTDVNGVYLDTLKAVEAL